MWKGGETRRARASGRGCGAVVRGQTTSAAGGCAGGLYKAWRGERVRERNGAYREMGLAAGPRSRASRGVQARRLVPSCVPSSLVWVGLNRGVQPDGRRRCSCETRNRKIFQPVSCSYLWFRHCFRVGTHQQLHRRRAAQLMLTAPYVNRGKPVFTQRNTEKLLGLWRTKDSLPSRFSLIHSVAQK